MQLNLADFKKQFPDDHSCFEFLVEKKWGEGFTCRKCKHSQFTIGRKWHHRRCKKCRYEESATAHTLFHKIKFSLLKAFEIIHHLSSSNQGLSTVEMAIQFEINQSTAWFFKRKVQQAFYNIETDFLAERSGQTISDHLVRLRTLLPSRINRITKVTFDSLQYNSRDPNEILPARIMSIHIKGKTESNGVKKHRKACGMRWLLNLRTGKRRNEHLYEKYRNEMIAWIRSTHQHISAKHMFYYGCEFNFRLNRSKSPEPFSNLFTVLTSMIQLPWFSYRLLAKDPVQS